MKSLRILLLLIFFFVLHATRSSVFALPNLQKVVITTPVQTNTIMYALPFPGMLPNHPLYVFKRLRDTLIEKMITNDVKKAEFYILQADKRLQMSVVLSSGKTESLAETMRNDAFMYREKSLSMLTKAAEKNTVIPRYVLEKLLLSSQKHKEVLQDMIVDTTPITNLITNIEALLKSQINKK